MADYSEVVDAAIESLPFHREPDPRNPNVFYGRCAVLDNEAEAKLLILAIADQAGLPARMCDKVAAALGVEPLKPK